MAWLISFSFDGVQYVRFRAGNEANSKSTMGTRTIAVLVTVAFSVDRTYWVTTSSSSPARASSRCEPLGFIWLRPVRLDRVSAGCS